MIKNYGCSTELPSLLASAQHGEFALRNHLRVDR